MKASSLLVHALRNLTRSLRRTIMISFIIGASAGTLYMMNCYREFMFFGLRMSYVDQSGHLQIARSGYWDGGSDSRPILSGDEYGKLVDILETVDGVDRQTSLYTFRGLGGTAERSDIIIVSGVETANYRNKVRVLEILEGRMIGPDDPMSIVVGKPLAERIGVSVGDWITVITTAVDGSFTYGEALVAGIATTGFEESDRYFGLVNLGFVQNLKGTRGVETVLVYLDDEDDLARVRDEIEQRADDAGLAIDIRDWISLNPYYLELNGMFRNINFVVNSIVSLLVFLAVLEILSMSFFERFRELGSLRAIGNTRGEILFLLLCEAVFYALAGIISGLMISHFTGLVINALDITWMPPGNSSPAPFRFLLDLRFAVYPSLIVLAASLAAAIIPACKASRLQVIEVLKYE